MYTATAARSAAAVKDGTGSDGALEASRLARFSCARRRAACVRAAFACASSSSNVNRLRLAGGIAGGRKGPVRKGDIARQARLAATLSQGERSSSEARRTP